MAKPSVEINGVTYSAVPYVEIPNSSSPGNSSFYYTGDADAADGNVLSGKKFYNSTGEVTGNMANNGSVSASISTKAGTVTVPAGYTSGGTIDIASAAVSDLQSAYLLSGKTVLGVAGSLTAAVVTQDSITNSLTIS